METYIDWLFSIFIQVKRLIWYIFSDIDSQIDAFDELMKVKNKTKVIFYSFQFFFNLRKSDRLPNRMKEIKKEESLNCNF